MGDLEGVPSDVVIGRLVGGQVWRKSGLRSHAQNKLDGCSDLGVSLSLRVVRSFVQYTICSSSNSRTSKLWSIGCLALARFAVIGGCMRSGGGEWLVDEQATRGSYRWDYRKPCIGAN